MSGREPDVFTTIEEAAAAAAEKVNEAWSDVPPLPDPLEDERLLGMMTDGAFTLDGMFDSGARTVMTQQVEEGPRELAVVFPRWPRLTWLYWFDRWLPAWCYNTWTGDVVLTEFFIRGEEYTMTLKPVSKGRWS